MPHLPEGNRIRAARVVRARIERARVFGLALCVLLAIPLGLSAAPAAAQQGQPSYYANPVGISLEQAADMIRQRTGGRVLSATPVTKNGQRGYNVRVLVDGKRVKQFYVDSEGRVSSR